MARKIQGLVVSDAPDKTVIVRVNRVAIHPLYKKRYNQSRRYPVDDPGNQAKVGNWVRALECRPLSRTKRWRLEAILDQSGSKVVKDLTKPEANSTKKS